MNKEFTGNQFLDPKQCDFEILGFTEELEDEFGKFLGMREYGEPDRPLGITGKREFVLTANTTLQRGHRTEVVKASVSRPLKVKGTLQIICGRVKSSPRCAAHFLDDCILSPGHAGPHRDRGGSVWEQQIGFTKTGL